MHVSIPFHAFVVQNPVAGVSESSRVRARIEEVLEKAGWTYEIYSTTGKEDVPALVRAAVEHGAQVVLAAGGDGTVSVTAAGVVGTNIPLGVLPVGTANAFAKEVGLPQDLESALALVVGAHTIRALDAMQVNERMAILNVSVGFSTRIISKTPRAQKRAWGFLAYLAHALVQLSGLRLVFFRLEVDGRKFTMNASEVFVANTGIGGLPAAWVGLNIHPGDGKIGLVVMRVRTALDLFQVGVGLLSGHTIQTPDLRILEVEHSLTIQTRKPMPVQADGDLVGNTPVHIRVLPQALKVISPE